MDIAKGLLDEQQKKTHSENITNVIYRQADFNTLVLNENEFDFINAWGTIHHIKELEHFFHQIRKALKKDGIMVIREYVGPDYLQFSDEQLRMVNSLLALMPEELRMYPNNAGFKQVENRINKKKLMRLDPTESVRSSDIIRVMNDFMKIIEFRETGGTILHPLTNGIAGNFEKSPVGESVLQALIEIEKALIHSRMLPSDYVFIVARPAK
jgi:ubiquinone/menaquinone biosynthesis C-methylase UbiE